MLPNIFTSSSNFIIVACFVATVILAYLAMRWLNDRWRCNFHLPGGLRQDYRLCDLSMMRRNASSESATKAYRAKRIFAFPSGRRSDALNKRLAMAGADSSAMYSRLAASRVFLMTVPPFLLLVAGFTVYIPLQAGLYGSCSIIGGGFLLPGIWLNRSVRRYRSALRVALPDFLDLVNVCLDAGLSIQQSIKRVGEELRLIHPAFSYEMSVVQRDIELGSTVDNALRRFADRTQYDAIRTLSTLVRQAQKFGTNLSEAIRVHSEMIRCQREQAAEEHAQKASVKIILPTMLFIFPAIFVVLVSPAAFQIQKVFASQP